MRVSDRFVAEVLGVPGADVLRLAGVTDPADAGSVLSAMWAKPAAEKEQSEPSL